MLTDFENLTSDAVFDRSLRLALEVAIAQSRFVNVFPPNRVQEALRRMQRPADERLDEASAAEVAVREGVKAVLSCSIAEVGGVYSITARLLEPQSRAAMVTESESAAGKDQVLTALDSLATRLRRRLGESVEGLSNQGVPLPQATTSALQALKLYAESLRSRDRAPGLLREAIAIDPDFALAHAELGRALYLQPEQETRLQAEQHYVKALGLLDRLTPRERLWITASAADSRGDRTGAVSGYQAYLERYPDETRAWFRLGWTLMAGLGDYAESTKAFERLVAVDPSDAGAHINLASSLAGLKRDAEAFAAYQRAFALDPALLTGQFINHEYGFLLVRMGKLDAAAETFGKAIAFADTTSQARGHRSLALLEMYRGHYGRATEGLRRAVTLHVQHRGGVSEFRDRMFLVRALEAQGEVAAARAELAGAEALAGRLSLGPEWHYGLAILHARAGRLGPARRALATMQLGIGDPLLDSSTNRNTASDRAQLALVEAEIARASRRASDALPLIESARSRVPVDALEALARALTDVNRLEEAVASYIEFLREQPLGGEAQEDWLAAHVRLGDLYRRLGRVAEARAQYDALLALWKDGDADLVWRRQAAAGLAQLSAQHRP